MLIKKPTDIPTREITPESAYLNRRTFMRAGVVAGTVLATGWTYEKLNGRSASVTATQQPPVLKDFVAAPVAPTTATGTTAPTTNAVAQVDPNLTNGFKTVEAQTPFANITNYNNFYEFSTGKESVAYAARNFVAAPWTVAIEGLVRKPKVFDLDELLKISPPEERVYRMRCVEGWSMVIPWAGMSLSKLLDRVEPLSGAKYVAFQTLLDPTRMPNQRHQVLKWPYVEGLRMDEAMHPLTILASGLYGRQLPPQNGAPLRLVVPWKYGFKGIKSIVKIQLLAEKPPTTWNDFGADEYGFYANVNPLVDHPRWSQATELRIGDLKKRETLMFNGYAEQVASLYAGMDLRANF